MMRGFVGEKDNLLLWVLIYYVGECLDFIVVVEVKVRRKVRKMVGMSYLYFKDKLFENVLSEKIDSYKLEVVLIIIELISSK